MCVCGWGDKDTGNSRERWRRCGRRMEEDDVRKWNCGGRDEVGWDIGGEGR